MTSGTIALIALLTICPLMMLLMHRAMGGGHKETDEPHERASLDELRRRRAELDARIAARESEEEVEPSDAHDERAGRA